MAGTMVYRLRVSSIDDTHMQVFLQAMTNIQQIEDNRGYHHIAGFHGRPEGLCWHSQSSGRLNIEPRLFLPWHRAYLWYLEQAMQDQIPNTALPWWDWTHDRQIPNAYAAPQIDGAPNPLYNFLMRFPSPNPVNRVTQRSPRDQNNLPTVEAIQDLYNKTNWEDFSDTLQDYHNFVHWWVGGDMANVTYAAFDPLFYAHHCMIDRIWYLWQVKHGNNNLPDELLDHTLAPFNKTCRDVINVQALGYEYATTFDSIDVSGDNND